MSKRFRTGFINAAGGRPLTPQSKTYRCVVATQWGCSGTTAGDHATINPCNYNTPLQKVSSTSWTVPTGISDTRHPSGHDHILADLYNTYLVKDAHLRIDIWFNGSNKVGNNFVIGYKFDSDSQSASPAFPATVATTEVWLDLQASPGWVWERFGCVIDGDRKTHGVMNIRMNNLPALTIATQKNVATTQFTTDDLLGVIGDTANAPAVSTFLHIVMINLENDGIPAAMSANSVVLSMRMTQTVKVWQKQEATELIDEAHDV